MVIFDYKPNGYGPDEYFSYSGDLASITRVPKDANTRVNGWLLTSNVLWFRKVRFVVFGKGDEIFLHSVGGVFNCSSGDTDITYRRFLNLLFVKIYERGTLKAEYAIYTPIMRFLANDGMFPSEAEPLHDVLTRITDPAEHRRLAKSLSMGIALPVG
jgi:hypothetical protein